MADASLGFTEQAFQPQAGDEQLLVRFTLHPQLQRAESDKAGRPIYREKEYISIRIPGDKSAEVFRPVREKDKNRWPEHYRKFQAREAQIVEGTPLAEWPPITRSQVEELKWLNITTVEQLANVNDSNAQHVMGVGVLKKKAQAFLDAAEKKNTAANLERELAKRDAELKELRAMVEKLGADPAEAVPEPAPAPKRRRKAVEE